MLWVVLILDIWSAAKDSRGSNRIPIDIIHVLHRVDSTLSLIAHERIVCHIHVLPTDITHTTSVTITIVGPLLSGIAAIRVRARLTFRDLFQLFLAICSASPF